MRSVFSVLVPLALCAFGAGAASAQSPLDCAVSQSVCEDQELIGLEGERKSLVQQLTSLDPQHAALANEQTWIDGLGACGEDVACYRTAYLNHNQSLRQAVGALPGAPSAEALEAPADAPTVEEQTAVLDAVQEERLRDAAEEAPEYEPREPGQVYVDAGLPGWGFFTAIGVTLFIWWRLMSARGRVQREVRAAEARLRGR
jgi:uncharacterized protein